MLLALKSRYFEMAKMLTINGLAIEFTDDLSIEKRLADFLVRFNFLPSKMKLICRLKSFYLILNSELDQGQPHYVMRLKPEFWAERDQPWQNYFVTIAKRLKNGQICHQHVPIVPREYMENPTEWPRGTTGTLFSTI